MARPAKAIGTATGARTKEDIAFREAMETKLKGDFAGIPKPPKYLSKNQKKIFRFITEGLASADIVSKMDEFVVTNTAIAVDRLQEIESMINEDISLLLDTKLTQTRAKYESCMWKGCQELCLSPQARAKIGSLAASQRKESADPLIQILGGLSNE